METEKEPILHIPVMLKEVLEYVEPKPEQTFLDCTFGAGGYSKGLLDYCKCSVVAIDRDPSVKHIADKISSGYPGRFRFIQANFADAFEVMPGEAFDGIVIDLGVSSMQLDSADRGFSFMLDGPLDMRMGNDGMSAADFINSVDEDDLANIIYKYGDEIASRRIARNIVIERKAAPFTTTGQLAKTVRSSIGSRGGKIDPATKTFQAIRIYINDELRSLELFLERAFDLLNPNGRLVVVSFHSLEDSIVKAFFRQHSAPKVARSKYDTREIGLDPAKWLKPLTKKSISPSREEVLRNPRSRSAKLRAAIKIGGSNAN